MKLIKSGGEPRCVTLTNLLSCCVGALMLCSVQVPAFAATTAATATAGAADAPADVDEMQSVTVTARRTAERLQDVPVAVTALSSDALAEQRIESQVDLQYATPGLTVRETGSSDQLNYSLRGQSIDAFSFASPAVVTYFNEVETDGGAATSLFDLEAIQVLKGPQGTLFGRNATGGAVLYGAKKPTNDFEGYLTVGYGNYDDREFEAAVNLPFTEGFAVRISGRSQERDGYQHNLLLGTDPNSIDSKVARVSLLIAPPGTGFSNIAMLQYGKFGGLVGQDKITNANGVNGAPSTYFDPITGTTQPLVTNMANAYPAGVVTNNPRVNSLFNGIGDFLTKQAGIGFYDLYSTADDHRYGAQTLVTNTSTYDLGEATQIKNIYGLNKVLSMEQSDIEGSPYDFLQVGGGTAPNDQGYTFATDQWSEELQLNGKASALKYIFGAYYSHDDTHTRIPLAITPDLGAPFLGPYDFTVTDKSKALYGQGTYSITDRLNFSGGFRYTWETVSITQGGDSLLNVLNGGDDTRHDHKPSWLIGVDYKLTSDLLLYFNQRGSWRTGGFNGTSAASFPNAATFKPETTYDFELGAKFAGHLGSLPAHLNLALYDQHVKDVQRAPYLNISALAGNVNKAEVTGLELDGSVDVFRWLELGASFSYADARYTDPHATVAGATFFFGPYADTPKETGTVYFRVKQNLPGDQGELALRGQLYAQSFFFYSNLNNTIVPGCEIGGYSIINLRAEWNGIHGSKLNAALYVNNVADRDYNVGGFPLGAVTGSNAVLPGTPRMFGVELNIKF
jgi:iron complex outermembrane recepter protein